MAPRVALRYAPIRGLAPSELGLGLAFAGSRSSKDTLKHYDNAMPKTYKTNWISKGVDLFSNGLE